MSRYDYRQAVRDDVLQAIKDNYTAEEIAENIATRKLWDDFAEKLHDDFWIDDAVTGNASGSYTFNTWQAEENLCHNFELIEECAREFGEEPTVCEGYDHGAEWWDVSIRCYLLHEAIYDALNELQNELEVYDNETVNEQ